MSGERDIVHAPHLQAAKLSFRALVDAFGGQETAAAETGRSQSRISVYGHRNTADFPPLDVIDALEDRTVGLPGWPHVTRWLCRRRGGAFLKLPDPNCPDATGKWSLFAARLAKESGDVTSALCAALHDDNDVSPAEARGCLREAAELVRIAVDLEHSLKMRAADDEGG